MREWGPGGWGDPVFIFFVLPGSALQKGRNCVYLKSFAIRTAYVIFTKSLDAIRRNS